ncbi:MAG: hypothetical protein OQL20_04600 [Sedimenticola sp.]|nr:hypothetical protein [Sedimenticola sp.]
MKTLIKVIAVTGLCLAAFGQAQAGSDHKRDGYSVRGDMKQLNRRIERGIDSGKISHREAKKLKHQQRSIRRMKRDFYDDGHLSRKERKILSYRIRRLNDRVYDYKHNDNYRVHKGYWNDRGHHRSYQNGYVERWPTGTIIYRW